MFVVFLLDCDHEGLEPPMEKLLPSQCVEDVGKFSKVSLTIIRGHCIVVPVVEGCKSSPEEESQFRTCVPVGQSGLKRRFSGQPHAYTFRILTPDDILTCFLVCLTAGTFA